MEKEKYYTNIKKWLAGHLLRKEMKDIKDPCICSRYIFSK
jgi:hypothetical protein